MPPAQPRSERSQLTGTRDSVYRLHDVGHVARRRGLAGLNGARARALIVGKYALHVVCGVNVGHSGHVATLHLPVGARIWLVESSPQLELVVVSSEARPAERLRHTHGLA